MDQKTRTKVEQAARLLDEATRELTVELKKTRSDQTAIQLGAVAAAKAALETV